MSLEIELELRWLIKCILINLFFVHFVHKVSFEVKEDINKTCYQLFLTLKEINDPVERSGRKGLLVLDLLIVIGLFIEFYRVHLG